MGCVYARMINGDFGGMIWLAEILGVFGTGEENTQFERGICILDVGSCTIVECNARFSSQLDVSLCLRIEWLPVFMSHASNIYCEGPRWILSSPAYAVK